MLDWPSDLPSCLMWDDFQYPHPDGRVRSPMDRGPTKVRGSSRGTTTTVPCSIIVRRGGLYSIEAFLAALDASGDPRFIIRDPRIDGAKLLNEDGEALLDEDGDPIRASAVWIVKFGPTLPVERRLDPARWRVSFDLERLF